MRYILHTHSLRPTHTTPDGQPVQLIMIADGATVRTPFPIHNAENKAAAIVAENLTPIPAK